jgi:DNA-binding transcriptional regulator LsrR (DeoR family)
VARRIADTLQADCYQLTAPLVVADAATRAALWTEEGLRDLRARARRADVALVSCGDLDEAATLYREGLVSRAELARLRRAGAVADVLCQFIDGSGRPVDHPLNRRTVAVPLADLRAIGTLVLASGGAAKAGALAAALAAVRVHVLVTDEAAAEALARL